MPRVGLFGGTFDPPHVGHLAIAEWARERLRLDRVVFIPSGRPPHKQRRDLSRARARLAMTRLAVRGNRAFTVSLHEMQRGAPPFTVDTLRALVARSPRTRFFLLIGADSLDDFPRWQEPDAILELATLAVAGRVGSGPAGARSRHGRQATWIGNPEIAVSSSELRARVRAGLSIRYLVPDAVAAYIRRHGLYRRRR